MGIKLKNQKALDRYLYNFGIRIEKALIYQLEYLVAELQNHAKINAGYVDQTSNLKGSIGGVVLKNGKPITFKGFDSDGSEGASQGKDYIESLISQHTSGYVILIVAGMEYATYVENYNQLNVLKKSELKLQAEIPKILNKLIKRLEKVKTAEIL